MKSLAATYDRDAAKLSRGPGRRWRSGPITWIYVSPRRTTIPVSGWKLHVSASALESSALLRLISQGAWSRKYPFKIPASLADICTLNAGEAGRTQPGKVLTVYVGERTAAIDLARDIAREWGGTKGPIVLTDVQCLANTRVSLRRGLFQTENGALDSLGRPLRTYLDAAGNTALDDYSDATRERMHRELPRDFVPVSPYPNLDATIVIQARRYKLLSVLNHSPRGPTFLAVDIATLRSAIVKVARKGLLGDEYDRDSMDRLRNEFRVLQLASQTDLPVPAPIALEEDGELAWLVVQDAGGLSFTELSRGTRLRLLATAARTLQRFHEAGLVHRDVKLSNFVAHGDEVLLVDCELSAGVGETRPFKGCTPGYAPADRGPAETTYDIYSFGVAILHALTDADPGFLALSSESVPVLGGLEGFDSLAAMLRETVHERPERRPRAAALAERLTAAHAAGRFRWIRGREYQPRNWSRRFGGLPSELNAGLDEFVGPDGSWRNAHLFPDHHMDGINVGSAGIIIGVRAIESAMPAFRRHAIATTAEYLARKAPHKHAHGLLSGNAGVALALSIEAKLTSRRRLVRACRERLRCAATAVDGEDFFSGAAGVVYAGLTVARVLKAEWPIEMVSPLVGRLMSRAKVVSGIPCWRGPRGEGDGDSQLGAAHGACGIAAVLGRWGRTRGTREIRQFADEVLRAVFDYGRGAEGATLRHSASESSRSSPAGDWCHGPTGFAWSILESGGARDLREGLDWALGKSAESPVVRNPTFCHGLAGCLEVMRMAFAEVEEGRWKQEADRRAMALLATRRMGARVGRGLWSSEASGTCSPDLWVGFLGPAVQLALLDRGDRDSVLSLGWLGTGNPE